jgi:pimeloyl-ACP methyl ester carboxylesterase
MYSGWPRRDLVTPSRNHIHKHHRELQGSQNLIRMESQSNEVRTAESFSRFITHPNGQITHVYDDNFTDPWKPCETIMIQPGFARHGRHWYHWVPALAHQYRVIRRDSRGHGLSSSPGGTSGYEYSLDTILEEIINTMDQLGLEKVHFLGESTSGMVGEALAAKYPHRLLSLTICASPTHLPPAALKLFAFGYSSWPVACRELGSRGWAQELADVPGTVSMPDKEYVQWWIDQVAVSTGSGLAGYAEFLTTADARPFLEQISLPTLILAPAKSAATKLDEQIDLQKRIKGSQIVVIHGEGHEIYVQKPQECQEALFEFIKALGKKMEL